ncbi:MAG: TlpA disulfide reductase family protein [Gammaproteobacteria bacterium]|nr:TlpA disulfide reductase family protein [Gammaproteobacteria bacterium]MDJ0871274.1 TlpA disulfide reductase family protein [Gammaproteobacteria bacterium]
MSALARVRPSWAAAGLVLLVLAAWVMLHTADRRLAPEVEFVTLSGQRIGLNSLRGHPVLVTFWSTSCGPCVDDMGHLIRMHEELEDRGLRIVAVAMPYDPPNRVIEMARARGLPYTVALDVQGKAVAAFGDVPGTPTTYLIGPDGGIRARTVGPLDVATVTEQLLTMMESA